MENGKFSFRTVTNGAIASMQGRCKKIFIASLLQYMIFLIAYLLTNSLLISFICYTIFLSAMTDFLDDVSGKKRVEDIFKIGFNKKLYVTILLSMIVVFLGGIGFALFIVPAIILFANYALIFDELRNNDLGLVENFQTAKTKIKGYKWEMALLFLVFLLILVLLTGVGILITYVAQFAIVGFDAIYIKAGIMLGVSAFMIFVTPIELICLTYFSGVIERDKIYKEQQLEEEKNKKDAEIEKNIEKVNIDDIVEQPKTQASDNDQDPTDLIF